MFQLAGFDCKQLVMSIVTLIITLVTKSHDPFRRRRSSIMVPESSHLGQAVCSSQPSQGPGRPKVFGMKAHDPKGSKYANGTYFGASSL